METVFWFSFLMIFYAYFGYPLCVSLLISIGKKRENRSIDASEIFQPSVSFIIAAYNEEEQIKEKIRQTLLLDYPQDRFEIIVASDCSTDQTDAIVRTFNAQGVKLVRAGERLGKENAQRCAIEKSNGDIIVFSDVATILNPDGVRRIVENFRDQSVGCVSSVDKFIDAHGKVSGEGAYVRYEMFLRHLESKMNSLVGLSGSFFAARRQVCETWSINLQSDFNTLLNSIRMGYHGISDPESIGYYKNLSDEKKEFDRKVRTVLRGISAMMRNIELLNPIRHGIFAWQLLSHKLCRWLVPWFLLLLLLSNTCLVFAGPFYFLAFGIQVCVYYLFYDRYRKQQPPDRPLLKIPYFFFLANYAILVAWIQYFRGERRTFWEPSKR